MAHQIGRVGKALGVGSPGQPGPLQTRAGLVRNTIGAAGVGGWVIIPLLLAPETHAMHIHGHPALAPFGRPYCPVCTAPMFIVSIEPDKQDHEAHTYECPKCRFLDTAVVRC